MYSKYKGALFKRALFVSFFLLSHLSFSHAMDDFPRKNVVERSFHLSVILSAITRLNLQDLVETTETGDVYELVEFMIGENNISLATFCMALPLCGVSLKKQFPEFSSYNRLDYIRDKITLCNHTKIRSDFYKFYLDVENLYKTVGAELFFIPKDTDLSSNKYYFSIERLNPLPAKGEWFFKL